AGGVRGEDRMRLRHGLDFREQRALGLEVLEDRLDHDVGARGAGARYVRDQPVERVAQTAAMSPPMTPAPTTWTCRAWKPAPLARPFSRSWRKKMRIRFAVVGC